MIRIGFVGWRGMVGSVLLERMRAENDFTGFEPVFFSTSQIGGPGPDFAGSTTLLDAHSQEDLRKLDAIVSCQGGDYTTAVYRELRQSGWKGYWIDAASTLRMESDAIIILDPINRRSIDQALREGQKTFVGGNCTVSLMLMALSGLFKAGLVEWLSSMTYQSASGAGAKNMTELVRQMHALGAAGHALQLEHPSASALELDRAVGAGLVADDFPTEAFGAPLAASLIPWIDKAMENGQTREEWKGMAETNKILCAVPAIPVDGICVRVGVMRCHSQALTVKLTRDVPLDELTAMIASSNEWVKVVPNDKASTLRDLTPAAVSGTLTVPIGRLRKMALGPQYLTGFTVGDQLLWGAAEPLRRMLCILLQHLQGE